MNDEEAIMGKVIPIQIKLEDGGRMPVRATEGSVGFDIFCNEYVELKGYEHRLVNAGFKIELPQGYEAQIRPRSGLAHLYGVTVLNSPGTIDSDYRGVVGVILYNSSNKVVVLKPETAIAQMVIQRVPEVCLIQVDSLSETERGEGGFGSTDERK